MAAYTLKWCWKYFKAVGTYFQVVWECVNISTFWRLVLKGPSYSIGLDINFPPVYSVCACARTLVYCMTTTYFKMDDSCRFSGSRRNIGLEMEDVERRLLIISNLEKKFLNSLFQDMPNTRNLYTIFLWKMAFHQHLGTHCLSPFPYPYSLYHIRVFRVGVMLILWSENVLLNTLFRKRLHLNKWVKGLEGSCFVY